MSFFTLGWSFVEDYCVHQKKLKWRDVALYKSETISWQIALIYAGCFNILRKGKRPDLDSSEPSTSQCFEAKTFSSKNLAPAPSTYAVLVVTRIDTLK